MAVNCPNCGTKQTNAARTVTILQTIQDGAIPTEVDVDIFECTTCKALFTQDITTQIDNPKNEKSWTGLMERLSKVQLGLKQNLANLRENLIVFETECSGVLFELETIRKGSESKAIGLKEDVNRLRAEIQDLRDALGLKKET